MGKQWRGAGDWAFGLPRATYEKGPADEGRLDPLYRPASGLRTSRPATCATRSCPWARRARVGPPVADAGGTATAAGT